jgi:hypothetical protein
MLPPPSSGLKQIPLKTISLTRWAGGAEKSTRRPDAYLKNSGRGRCSSTSRPFLRENNMLDQALAYSNIGWPVFPCWPQTKKPLTKHGFKDASLEEKQLRSWWDMKPDANVAIRTGSCCNIVVLDIDPRNGGDDTLARLIDEHGALPKTVHAKTGGGGDHFYFNHPGGSLFGSLDKGIDVKADGGYVIAAPSIHQSGQEYRWLVSPLESALAPLPKPLTELIQRPEKHATNCCDSWVSESLSFCVSVSVKQWVEESIALTLPSGPGQRNRAIFNFARKLKAHPELKERSPVEMKRFVSNWFQAARSKVSGEHDFEDTWADFIYGWQHMKYADGEGPMGLAWSRAISAVPPACAEGHKEVVVLLICLCRELQILSKDQPFYLACREAGRCLNIDRDTANKYLGMLAAEGILERTFKGTRKRASEYFYRGP